MKEWHNLTTNIYDAVDQHLAQSHVQYFTDLSDAEKSLVLERAARSLKSTTNGGRNYALSFQQFLIFEFFSSFSNAI